MTRRRIHVQIVMSLALGAAALAVPLASASAASPTPSSTKTPPAGGAAPDGDPAVVAFSSQVETIGEEQYPDSFAGAVLTPSGVTDVYALVASDSGLVSAINAANTSGFPVTVIGVSRSWSQLEAVNSALLQAHSSLQSQGIDLAEFGPDPASNSVVATVANPTNGDVSALAAAVGAQVSSSNYSSEVLGLLESQFGQGITVQMQSPGVHVSAAYDRNNDISPYYDGDQIYGSVGIAPLCTSGFNMEGKGSGNTYMYTAGHCGTGTWRTGAESIGHTATNYLSQTSGNDF